MLEEGASFLSVGLFLRGFLATCTGVLTLHFLAQLKNKGVDVGAVKFGIRRDLGCVAFSLSHQNLHLYNMIIHSCSILNT